jgi:hypothetical protein
MPVVREELTRRAEFQLERIQRCHELERQDPRVARRLQELRRWQASRLAHTYEDLRHDAGYDAAVEFFLSDLYAEEGSGQRDQLLERTWPLLRRTLRMHVLELLVRVFELQAVTMELDAAMVRALGSEPLSARSYRRAYRQVGQEWSRARQIDLLTSIGSGLGQQLHSRWISTALRMAHAPAHAAGFGALQSFLERGHASFRALREPATFLALIGERERRLMEVLFTGEEGVGLTLLQTQDASTHAVS